METYAKVDVSNVVPDTPIDLVRFIPTGDYESHPKTIGDGLYIWIAIEDHCVINKWKSVNGITHFTIHKQFSLLKEK